MTNSLKSTLAAICSLLSMSALADWTYDGSAKTLADSNGWVLKATASGNNLTITGVDTSSTGSGALDLSQAISDGLQITTIGAYAFCNKPELTSVTLPSTSLKTLGQGAFAKNANLTTVTPFLPDSITSMDQAVFYNCTALTGDLTLGGSGANVSLTDNWLSKNNPIGNISIGGQFYATKIMSATLGNGVKSITGAMFRLCPSLTTVTLGNAVTSIGAFAFKNCSALETVTPFLPTTLTSMGGGAFADCTKLKGVVHLGESVATFTFGTGSWDSSIDYCGQFRNCSSLEGAVLGDGVKSIPQQVFYKNTSLASVTFGANLTSIGSKTFFNCTALTSVALPTGLTTIGSGCFGKCSNLETIAPFLPEGVNAIGQSAFWGCAKLKGKLTLGMNNAVSLTGGSYDKDFENSPQYDQFRGCSSIQEVELGEYMNKTVRYMFRGCTSLTNVVFHGDLPTFDNSTFNDCANYQMRWYVPSLAGWLAFGNDSTKVTPWNDLADETKAKYTDKFGEEITPKGATVGFQKQFLAFEKAVVLDKLLAVVGEPSALGVVTPVYDDVPANVGEQLPLAFSAPEYAEDGNTIWRCVGYRIDTLVDTDWVEGTPVAATSGSYNAAEAGTQRLVWLWEKAGYKVSSIALPEGMSMTASVQPTLQGYYPAGTVVTFTAVGDSFECWCGDTEGATVDGNVITVTIDGEKSISPYFATPWVIDGSTMTDGYHTFNVSVNNELLEVSLNSFKNICVAPILDLTKPVVGGYKIVSVPAFYNKAGNPYVAALKECRFAGTIRTYGKYNYQGISIKMTIPEENDVVGILEGAFSGASGLSGPLVLKNATEVSGINGTRITLLDLNENISYVSSLGGNPSLERVVIRYRGDNLTFAKYWRQSCSSLKEIVFYGSYNPAGITEGWNSSARTGTNVRYLVPFATDPSWQALASQEAIDAKKFTPWRNCTAANQNTYWSTFGTNAKKPIGYTTVPGAAWLVELREPSTMLFLR